MKLEVEVLFEDINTYDKDTVLVEGNNRSEIMGAIKKLLTRDGVEMYGRIHKWRILKPKK